MEFYGVWYTIYISVYQTVCTLILIRCTFWLAFSSFRVTALFNSKCCLDIACQLLPHIFGNILILCIHIGETLNICMKIIWYWKSNFLTKWQHFELGNFFTFLLHKDIVFSEKCIHRGIHLYQSFCCWHLILCIQNVDTLNICIFA